MSTTLIQRLKAFRGLWLGDGIHPSVERQKVIDVLEQQAAQIAEKDAEIARLRGIVPEFLEKMNDELCAENDALRADAARYAFIREHWTRCSFAWNKDSANSLKSIVLTITTARPARAGLSSLDQEIDAALRQEQPT